VVHFPFIPLVDGDDVFLSGVFRLFRLDGKIGGGALTAAYQKPQVGLHRYVERAHYDSALYTTTIWKKAWEALPALADYRDAILITHYISDQIEGKSFMGYDITVEIPIRSLVAFDATSREVLWQTGQPPAGPRRHERRNVDDRGLGEDPGFPEIEELLSPESRRSARSPLSGDDDEWLAKRDFSYTSPVIVKGGLVVGGGWVQKGFVHGALRALDIRTGTLVWETLLAGAQVEPTMFGEMAREPFSGSIAEADGVVYYLTQMGTIAAVELETGHVLWLTTYDTIELVASFSHQAIRRELSWGPNPLLLLGHVLIATPRDSDYLYAIGTAMGPEGASVAGSILWRYWNEEEINDPSKKWDLLGFYRDRLYFTGTQEISALDLSSMEASGYLGAGGAAAPVWERPRPGEVASPPSFGAFTTPNVVKGPGVLTTSGVLYSDEEGIRLVDLDLASERALSPGPYRDSKWGSYPGRLQVDGVQVLMTSRELISAYTLGQ
jgi:outer membrane protein assembly factor BamB